MILTPIKRNNKLKLEILIERTCVQSHARKLGNFVENIKSPS